MKTPQTTKQIHVALFCGGRGSASIIQELLRWTNINLTLIVNAYDDGLSTGALRGFISEMLGPSDFRKNLSYLLNPYSEGQYALKNLLEFRLPKNISDQDILSLIDYCKTGKADHLIKPINNFFSLLDPVLAARIRHLLTQFFNYSQGCQQRFDFRDCSIGNLIFAGAYLEKNQNFNAATKEISQLVSSRASLVNVSNGENRILIGLKEDGELLTNEAQIVGPQSRSPIKNIYLVRKPLTEDELIFLEKKNFTEKNAWLKLQESLPNISLEAQEAITKADIIIYGPGTQHSSLFPSYQIAKNAIQKSAALVKALVMNLEPDNDIQSLTASDITDSALYYLGDSENKSKVVTHILLNHSNAESKLAMGKLSLIKNYKNAHLILDNFSNGFNQQVHNGRAIIEKLLQLLKKPEANKNEKAKLDIFIDINKRSLSVDSVSAEFMEMDWQENFSKVSLTINQKSVDKFEVPESIKAITSYRDGIFPEIDYFSEWLQSGESEYLVLLTGDGEYRFRDVLLGIRLLEQSNFGAVFGSRTQSRLQFKTSMQAAYGENKILGSFSFLGAFLLSAIYALRFGVIFSDPLTGFRIFKHSRITHVAKNLITEKAKTPVKIAKSLIANKIDIAELPVNYKTFSGFTDPHWRIRRSLKNLLSIFI